MIVFSGDIHGKLETLVWSVVERYKITCASIIVLGDFGVGFGRPHSMDDLYEKVRRRLEKYDITIYTIRGNHDDPSWFDGNHNYDRLIFLEDYKVLTIEGAKILPIGGAISIDRDYRIKMNSKEERVGSKKRYYWEGEDVTKVDIKSLPKSIDIVISHEAPSAFFIPCKDDNIHRDIKKDILESREYLSKVLNKLNPSTWLFGHYHITKSDICGITMWTCLGELELKEQLIYGF